MSISPTAVLLLEPGSAVGAGRSLYREPSTLEAVLTLPLVNPPISRGLLKILSCLLAVPRESGSGGVMQRFLLPAKNGRDGSRAAVELRVVFRKRRRDKK